MSQFGAEKVTLSRGDALEGDDRLFCEAQKNN